MSYNFNNPLKYKGYGGKSMDMETITAIYKDNDVSPMKVWLYHDAVRSLCERIFSTYLGDDYLTDEDKVKHFDWCWDKTVDSYFQVGYNLDNKERYKYFLNFFLSIYYLTDDKSKKLEDDIITVWDYIFNINIKKCEKDLYNFIEIYNMFKNNLR